MNNVWIVAQTGVTAGQSEVSAEPVKEGKPVTVVDSNVPGRAAPANAPPAYTWVFIVVIFVVMYMILFREPRKRQKQQQQMVQSLKKNDKVRTIGGIIGTVVDVKDDQVLLKVDESNNTKIWFLASAIGKNMSGEGKQLTL
jgi:preprotein translocase subunit YajC